MGNRATPLAILPQWVYYRRGSSAYTLSALASGSSSGFGSGRRSRLLASIWTMCQLELDFA